jgi:hypothetical protein
MTTDQQPQSEAPESRKVLIDSTEYLDKSEIKDVERGGSSWLLCRSSKLPRAPTRGASLAMAQLHPALVIDESGRCDDQLRQLSNSDRRESQVLRSLSEGRGYCDAGRAGKGRVG